MRGNYLTSGQRLSQRQRGSAVRIVGCSTGFFFSPTEGTQWEQRQIFAHITGSKLPIVSKEMTQQEERGGCCRSLPASASTRWPLPMAPRGDGFGRGAHGCSTLVAPLLIPFVSRMGCFPWDAPWDAFLSLCRGKRGRTALVWWHRGTVEGQPWLWSNIPAGHWGGGSRLINHLQCPQWVKLHG